MYTLKKIIMSQKAYIRHSEQLISLIFFVKTYHKDSKACLDTYAAIAKYWNPQGNIFPNQETLAALVGVQTRTIRTHISQLKKLNLLDFHQPNEKGKPPRSNVYTFITDTLKKWVDEAKKERNAINKALREERRAFEEMEKQLEQEIISDPTPPEKDDPPITSSLHSEDITNTITGNFVPTALDYIFRDASISEDNHRESLIIGAAKQRREKFLSRRPKVDVETRWDQTVRKHHQEAMNYQSKIDELETALISWTATKKPFTHEMLDMLYKLRDNKLNPMLEKFAAEFKKAQPRGWANQS